MNAFIIALTIFAAPVNVQNAALTLQPQNVLSFSDKTEKATLADCVRVQKALTASHMIAFCSDVQPISTPVASVQ